MGIEFELKYGCGQAAMEALRRYPCVRETLFQMQTTYYDTPGGDFSARRCTLRLRLENGKSICTLKTPDQGFGRQEWEVEGADIRSALDMLCKLGAPEDLCRLGKAGLVPICGARFSRIAKTVTAQDCEVELALDQGVLTGGGQEAPLQEVEVELKSGSREACVAFAKALAEEYALAEEPKSKFSRALALGQGG